MAKRRSIDDDDDDEKVDAPEEQEEEEDFDQEEEEDEDFDEQEEEEEEAERETPDEAASPSASPSSPPRPATKKSKTSSAAAAAAAAARRPDLSHHRATHPKNTSTPAEAGLIKSIYLENFMCHRKLSVDLNSNVNFIHGDNGSGKSAILAAIQICLGSNARRTGRARNLKELIRDKGPYAKVRVSLTNGGSDGYKQDVYGNVIQIERTISSGSGGGGGFHGTKLLSAAGKECSRSRKELAELLDHLNIQVDNPVSVLDQEEAKKFLTGHARDKYNFFMKATELERISAKHADAVEEIHKLNQQHDKMKASLNEECQRVDRLKQTWRQHQELEKLQEKVQSFLAKAAWAKYTKHQQAYEQSVAAKDKMTTKAQAKLQELEQAQLAVSQSQSGQGQTQHDLLQERIGDLIQEGQAAAQRKQDLEDTLREAEHPKKTMARQIDALARSYRDNKKKLAACQQRLAAKRDEILAKANNSEEARLTAILQDQESKLEQARSKTESLNEQLGNTRREYEELQPKVEQAKDAVKNLEGRIYHATKQLERLEQAGSGDEFAALGRNVKKVHDMVQKCVQQKKFRGPVVGPIAKYIKIAPGKEQFAKIAELALGTRSLDKFVVTCDEDRVLLQSIREKCGCRQDCGIYQTHNDPRFNIPEPPSEGIETVATVLAISHDLVFNILVDMGHIEQKALAMDKESSERGLLIQKPNGELAIKGSTINECYFLPKGDHWNVKNGALSMVSNERELRKTLGSDNTQAIASAKEDKIRLTEQLKPLRQEASKLEHEHTQAQKAWGAVRKEHKVNEKKIIDLSSKIEELKMEIDCLDNIVSDTKVEEEELLEVENEIEQIRDEEAKLKEEMDALQPRIDEIKKELEQTNQRNDQIITDMTEAQQKLTNLLETQAQQEGMVERFKQKLVQYEELIAKHQEKVDQCDQERQKSLYKARLLHHSWCLALKENGNDQFDHFTQSPSDEELETIDPVIITDKDTEYYKTKAKRAQEKVDKERKKQRLNDEDPEEAKQRYLQANANLGNKVQKVTDLESHIARLSVDIRARERLWQDFLTCLKEYTGTKFDQMLRLNNYNGELDFNDTNKTLDLIVQKGTQGDSKTKDVKGLSGGERSYTTMCLLIALGEHLETPFVILDEFDVFLDPQNRKLVMSVLIHTAKLLLHRQFIFITPQDLTGIAVDNLVRIHKLNPPERHNRAGALTQSTLEFPGASQAS